MSSMSMADKIKELRKSRNMTLEDVAKIVGVGKSTVRKWETGMIANMRRDKIAALATALGTTPAYLMGWDNISECDADDENPWILKTCELMEKVDIEKQIIIFQQAEAIVQSIAMPTDTLTEQEKTLLLLFRETTEEGKMRMIQSILNINDTIKKRSASGGNSSLA